MPSLRVKRRKHVLVEKPIDVTLQRADEIIDCCKENRVLLRVVFQSRFTGASRLLKEAIECEATGNARDNTIASLRVLDGLLETLQIR